MKAPSVLFRMANPRHLSRSGAAASPSPSGRESRWSVLNPFLTTAFCLIVALYSAGAFTFLTNPPCFWQTASIPVVLKLGPAGRTLIDGNTSYDNVAAQALANWNAHIGTTQFSPLLQSPGIGSWGDSINQQFFNSTVYGQAFGSNTLAVTKIWYSGTRMVEADITFNSAVSWDSYRGPLRWPGGQLLCDLKRVALHESGHVLGLDHPDQAGQTVSAIMNSIMSDLDDLTPDDIAGAQALYPAQAASITAQPQSQTVIVGGAVTFSVTAAGSQPLLYQWRFNGANISGAKTTSYQMSNVQTNQAGNYTVVVSNQGGAATSSVAVLTVMVPPSITAQPQGRTVAAGNGVTFSVTASGSAPLRYQWFQNNSALAGATTVSYTISATQPSDAGDYRVHVSNSAGDIDSSTATLTVQYAPVILAQPQSQTLTAGANATFSVSAGAFPPPAFQWRFNGAKIPGATLSSYTLTSVETTNGGNYQVIVTNSLGSTTSQLAVLTVNRPPTVALTSPANAAVFIAPVAIPLASTASDPDGTIARVDFYQGTTLLGTVTTTPYTVTWPNVPPGTYTLTAKATDNFGAATVSAPVNVTVNAFMNGLVAYYPLDGNMNDASGYGNDGALVGYDWKYSLDRFGQQNSLYLNTTSNPSWNSDGTYVTAPKSPLLDFNQDFTLSVWINLPNGVPSGYVHNLVSDGPDNTSVNLRVISDVDGSGSDYLQFVCVPAGDVHAIVDALRSAWWQAVVVRSASGVSLFRNGVLLTNSTMAAIAGNYPIIWFARHNCPGYPTTCPGSYPLLGGIDDVRFFNRALSAHEVAQLYQYERNTLPSLTITGPPLGLTLYLAQGTTNQVESSSNLGAWTAYGPPIPGTNWVTYQGLSGTAPQQYFRIKQSP